MLLYLSTNIRMTREVCHCISKSFRYSRPNRQFDIYGRTGDAAAAVGETDSTAEARDYDADSNRASTESSRNIDKIYLILWLECVT